MRLAITLASLLALTSPHVSAEIDGGGLLQQSCQGCHDNKIYQRAQRIVFSYGELDARVRFCERNNHVGWNDEQFEAVVDYLNTQYYNFKKPW